jgi:hypothetical protein
VCVAILGRRDEYGNEALVVKVKVHGMRKRRKEEGGRWLKIT